MARSVHRAGYGYALRAAHSVAASMEWFHIERNAIETQMQ